MSYPLANPGVFKQSRGRPGSEAARSTPLSGGCVGRRRRLRSVAGRIREEDIAEVREKARIDEVVSSYVTLRNAGGGSMKGLCPFHDEKSPSFNVTPSRGMYYCFGCGAGGDVIKFVMDTDGLGFSETVERLAEKYGVQLRYEEGGPARPRTGPQRPRLVEAHKVTEQWYAEQLATPEALAARQFLDERGFDAEAAAHFGVGFSPRGGEDLYRYLRQKDFTDEELVTSGLVGQGGRGHYDRFRGRLMWPIRDSSGDTIGFGARRIFDDDRIEAKYLNTPETPDLQEEPRALRPRPRPTRDRPGQPGRDRRGLHRRDGLPPGRGEDGGGHLRDVLRRRPRPGDPAAAAGPRRVPRRGDLHLRRRRGRPEGGAARVRGRPDLRRADLRRRRAERDGPVRPAALPRRPAEGDAAVRELVARRVPLYRFVLANVVQRYDLDRADGRIDALREAAKLVTSIRDRSKVDAFSRELAGMLGIEPADVQREVRRAAARGECAVRHRRRCAPGATTPSCPTRATRA